jgi:SAM-dependent methyltransferase
MQTFGFDSYAGRFDDPRVAACWLVSRGHNSMANTRFFCGVCDQLSEVQPAAPGQQHDLREGMVCVRCGLNARIRAAFNLLQQLAPESHRIYVTEQATRTFVEIQRRYPGVEGSEYEPDADGRAKLTRHLHALGGSGEVGFRDVTALDFPSGSLDVIVSFDVLEHVPKYQDALSEFARVLKPGGALLATFPFNDAQSTLMRASLADGGIVHHQEPEYHGDPVRGGILCFYHFGWDILDQARLLGFSSATMKLAWAPEQSVYYGNWILEAIR